MHFQAPCDNQGQTLGKIMGAYYFDKMMSHFPIVLEQKAIVFQSIGG